MSLSLLLFPTSVDTRMHSFFKTTAQEPIVQVLSRTSCTFAESRLFHSQRSLQTRHPTERLWDIPLGTCPCEIPRERVRGRHLRTCSWDKPWDSRGITPVNVLVGQALGTCRRNTPCKRVGGTSPGNMSAEYPL